VVELEGNARVGWVGDGEEERRGVGCRSGGRDRCVCGETRESLSAIRKGTKRSRKNEVVRTKTRYMDPYS
jgi:hypothetical protein